MIKRDRLIQTFLVLVQTDSPSGKEGAIAQRLIAILQELGADAGLDSHGNVIASLAGKGDPLLLSAHMDTVQPGEGIKSIVEGDTVRTNGATVLAGDPKAGVSAIIEGLRSLTEDGANHRAVEVAFSSGEEIGLVGARHMDYERISARAIPWSGWQPRPCGRSAWSRGCSLPAAARTAISLLPKGLQRSSSASEVNTSTPSQRRSRYPTC